MPPPAPGEALPQKSEFRTTAVPWTWRPPPVLVVSDELPPPRFRATRVRSSRTFEPGAAKIPAPVSDAALRSILESSIVSEPVDET